MTRARMAQAVVCKTGTCNAGHMLVRGDQISFVSVEQLRRVGYHRLDERRMPSDIAAPEDYVIVHDTTGVLLDRCDFHVVKWSQGGTLRNHPRISPAALNHARKYFGPKTPISMGKIDIPDPPWRPIGKIQIIRYRRIGAAKLIYADHPELLQNHDPDDIVTAPFEHKYDVPVSLLVSQRPLAWRLPLPEGCIVTERGFEVP